MKLTSEESLNDKTTQLNERLKCTQVYAHSVNKRIKTTLTS